ncbi:MAG: 50S ribosomal protein L23 [Chlamydiae bacterium]|nr:50S ribosomal protein L23 [Chlamydiota bacterium]
MKDPFNVVKARYVTEKATMLEQLHLSDKNRCLARCDAPKAVFLVRTSANKQEIAKAVEEIYKEKNVKVTKVNTILTKGKPKKRGRARPGSTASYKKAIVTLEKGDRIDEV